MYRRLSVSIIIPALIIALICPLATCETAEASSDQAYYTKETLTLPQSHYQLNPDVAQDPMFLRPNYESQIAVQNAKFIFGILSEHFSFVDHLVIRKTKGDVIGQIPNLYLAFPKAGTTSAFQATIEQCRCCNDGQVKESHYFRYWFKPNCTVRSSDLLIESCENDSVLLHFVRWLEKFDFSNVPETCISMMCMDGTTSIMWQDGLPVQPRAAPFHFPTFLRLMGKDKTKFLALIRRDIPRMRSEFFYFGDGPAQVALTHGSIKISSRLYERALNREKNSLSRILQGFANGTFTRDGASWQESTPRSGIAAYSCLIYPFVIEFGVGAVFITDVERFEASPREVFEWVFSSGYDKDRGENLWYTGNVPVRADAFIQNLNPSRENNLNRILGANPQLVDDERLVSDLLQQFYPIKMSTSESWGKKKEN